MSTTSNMISAQPCSEACSACIGACIHKGKGSQCSRIKAGAWYTACTLTWHHAVVLHEHKGGNVAGGLGPLPQQQGHNILLQLSHRIIRRLVILVGWPPAVRPAPMLGDCICPDTLEARHCPIPIGTVALLE